MPRRSAATTATYSSGPKQQAPQARQSYVTTRPRCALPARFVGAAVRRHRRRCTDERRARVRLLRRDRLRVQVAETVQIVDALPERVHEVSRRALDAAVDRALGRDHVGLGDELVGDRRLARRERLDVERAPVLAQVAADAIEPHAVDVAGQLLRRVARDHRRGAGGPAQLGVQLDERRVARRFAHRRAGHARHEVAVLGVVGGDAEDLFGRGVDDADGLAALDAVLERIVERQHFVARDLAETCAVEGRSRCGGGCQRDAKNQSGAGKKGPGDHAKLKSISLVSVRQRHFGNVFALFSRLRSGGFVSENVGHWYGVPMLVTDARYLLARADRPRRGIGGWIAAWVAGEAVPLAALAPLLPSSDELEALIAL